MIAKHMIQSGINVRKTAEILEIPLSTLYYSSCKAEKDMALTEMIKDIAFKYTFYGYRRIHMVIKRAGHHVNHKKVYRIYKTLNLQRQKPRKNKRLISVHMPLTQPRFCNHVWAIDFLFDSLTDRRLIKIMTIEDLMSRFCVGIEVGFSITANMVIEVIERCINVYGIPRVIRTDQGSEFRSIIFEKFIQRYGIRHEFIEKASPWQNGALESFNGKLREECLSRNLFETLMQARKVIDEYRKFYNTERPHSGICNKMPSEVFSNSS
ncbi:IS3 family transposase [Thermodesulfovibrio hydrogeniphilus]